MATNKRRSKRSKSTKSTKSTKATGSTKAGAPGKSSVQASAAASPSTRSVGALAAALERLAPQRLAESWDNTGLLLGDRTAPCERVVLTIDFTRSVLDEALDLRADAVVAYHPPIFDPLKSLTADEPRQHVLLEAAQAGLALLSPHTALDACRTGLSDWLAEGVAGSWREVQRAHGYEPLRAASELPGGEAFKIVVFVPHAAAARMREAMAEAGAGIIGRYDRCSTMTPVIGTFRGLPGSRPRAGQSGRVEEAAEIRLEMVVGHERLAWALAALRAIHPYETPAFEVHSLAARPSLDEGQGRLIALRTPATTAEIAGRLRKHLGVRRIEVAAPDQTRAFKHERIGLCAGSGFPLAADAFARGATLFVTGEARHHDQLACTARGCSLILAGHTNTERGYLPRLAEVLAASLPGVSLTCSRVDAHPLREA